MSFEITREERAAWREFYTARLHCAPPEEAAKQADEALAIWRTRRFPRRAIERIVRAADSIGARGLAAGQGDTPVPNAALIELAAAADVLR